MKDFIKRNGVYYKKFTDVPFNGKVSGVYNGSFINGLKNGYWVTYFKNGQLKSKGTFLNGIIEGLWEFFDVDGILKRKHNFLNGRSEGEIKIFHKNGNIKVEKFYLNNCLDGVFDYFDENGKFYRTETWKNGFLTQLGHFKNGLKDGIWKYYKKIKKIENPLELDNKKEKYEIVFVLSKLETFVDGIKEGLCIYRQPLLEEYFDICESEYFYEGHFRNGKKNGIWKYYYIKDNKKDGVRSEINFLNGKEDGVFIDEGNKGYFKQGKKHGKWTRNYVGGAYEKKEVIFYKDDLFHGPYMEFAGDQMICLGYYKNNLLDGKWVELGPNGWIKRTYKNGKQLDNQKEN